MPSKIRIGELAISRDNLAGVRITDLSSNITLCIDILEPRDCSYKLYTHSHRNHYPVNPPSDSISPRGPRSVKAGDKLSLPPFHVLVVDAYNVDYAGESGVHRRGESVGYVVFHGNYSIYHTGDTSLIPEMASLRGFNITMMFTPVGGGSVMEPEEASEAVKSVRPSIAIPIHYASRAQAERFKLLSSLYAQIIIVESRV